MSLLTESLSQLGFDPAAATTVDKAQTILQEVEVDGVDLVGGNSLERIGDTVTSYMSTLTGTLSQ